MDVKLIDSTYIANTYARFPVEIVGGNGSVAHGADGRDYIDMGSGIAVNIFGYSDSEWISAVTNQLGKFQHTSNLYYSSPCAKLAQRLCERTGMKKVFFANSGAEANECAIKAARAYAEKNKGTGYNIITLKNSFHGRTLATLSATGQDSFHGDFLPLPDGFLYAEANNTQSVAELVKNNRVTAIMFECVQGEGGVVPLTKSFVTDIAQIAADNDILLIADEVQTGNGRCGALYSYMNYGITPDIVTTAKGIGGGLPIGVAMLGEKVKDIFKPGMHGSTFGGNPVCCAGALNILSRLDDNLFSEVRRKSDLIVNTLNGANGIISVTGMGLMLGVETVRPAFDIISDCIANGVLVIKAKNKLRLLPSLNIPDELLVKALSVIKTAAGKDIQ